VDINSNDNHQADSLAGFPPLSPQIFISAAREDFGAAGQVRLALEAFFGKRAVYMDASAPLRLGEARFEAVKGVLADTWLVVCMVGKGWPKKVITDSNMGHELEYAASLNISFLPVLIDRARMPDAAALPEPLHRVASCPAEFLRPETMQRDLDFIVRAVQRSLEQSPNIEPDALRTAYGELIIPDALHAGTLTFNDRMQLMDRARGGDAGASLELGLRYLTGSGTQKSPRLALRYLELASVAGAQEATVNLVLLSRHGLVDKRIRDAALGRLDFSAILPLAEPARQALLEVARDLIIQGESAFQVHGLMLTKALNGCTDSVVVAKLRELADSGDEFSRSYLAELLFEQESRYHPMSRNYQR
jgi:TPR repeat protein